MTRYGYARVSTLKQDLQEQIDEIAAKGVNKKNIFSEKITGTKANRPAWLKLMNTVQAGDEIIVTKLDRLGRSLQVILKEVDELTDKHVIVTVGNMSFDRTTPTGKLMLSVMAAFAEFERDMIVDRMQGGRAYKRKNDPNYKEGRKRKLTPPMVDAMRTYYKNHTQEETAKAFNVSPRTVGNYMGKPEFIDSLTIKEFDKKLKALRKNKEKSIDMLSYTCLMLLASTNISTEEALALTWDDIDLKEMKIQINKKLVSSPENHKLTIQDIPSKNVSITYKARTILGDWRNRSKSNQSFSSLFADNDSVNANLVFNQKGQYISTTQVNQWLNYFEKETGFPQVNINDLHSIVSQSK